MRFASVCRLRKSITTADYTNTLLPTAYHFTTGPSPQVTSPSELIYHDPLDIGDGARQ